jgi:hypothetical protein
MGNRLTPEKGLGKCVVEFLNARVADGYFRVDHRIDETG